jgi:hypothetical protein
MRKVLALAVAAVLVSHTSRAQFSEFADDSAASQFTFSNGGNVLQIGGRISGYYEYRDLKSGVTNLSHNGWAMKDGDVDVLGKTANHFTYEFHVSLLDIVNAAATQNTADPAAPGFKAAYIRYDGLKFLGIKFGFDKLPFALGSIMPEHMTPLWEHANLNGGDLFSRRDFGLTLNSSVAQNHINIYAGAYSGMGENFFEYGNDASGTFEYIGRVEYCLTGKMKYRIVDEDHSAKPLFRVALNARYEDKTQPAGQTIGVDAPGKYGLRIINGKRLCYGGDATFMYKGFSTNFEVDMMQLKPADSTDPLFNGTPSSVNKGKVNAGGFVWDANYDFSKIHSVISARYEDVNVNDLVPGDMHWLSIGYAYKVNSFASVFKIDYAIPLQEDSNSDPLKYTGQLRVGYQIVF